MGEFSEILKRIRNEIGLSQKDFAARIEMKPAAYNMIESGKNQPSYSALQKIVSVFKLDANRLFDVEQKQDLILEKFSKKVNQLSETEFLNHSHELIKRINYLYQRLVDIRVLLFQEMRFKGDLTLRSEMELLNELARPSVNETNGEVQLKYPYENLNKEEKAKYLQKLDACLTLFTNTFFECFEQLFAGIRIPASKELRKDFLENREKLTDKFRYTHYLESYS